MESFNFASDLFLRYSQGKHFLCENKSPQNFCTFAESHHPAIISTGINGPTFGQIRFFSLKYPVFIENLTFSTDS